MDDTKMQTEAGEVISVREATEEELYYVDWARDKVREDLAFANDVAKQLANLAAILFGGSLAFLNDRIVSPIFHPWIVGVFLCSLVVSLLALMPFHAVIRQSCAADIKAARERAAEAKWSRVKLSAGLLAIALILCFVGMLARLGLN